MHKISPKLKIEKKENKNKKIVYITKNTQSPIIKESNKEKTKNVIQTPSFSKNQNINN